MGDGTNLRARALGLLSRREHTRAELKRKLGTSSACDDEIDQLLDDLASRQLLSDARYAEQRVASRSRRMGDARLRRELQTSGVDLELIDRALAAASSEIDRAREVRNRKFPQLPTSRDEHAKQARFLLARGFSSATIRAVLKTLPEQDGDG